MISTIVLMNVGKDVTAHIMFYRNEIVSAFGPLYWTFE